MMDSMKQSVPGSSLGKYQVIEQLATSKRDVSLIGTVSLQEVKGITRTQYGVIDLSQAKFGEQVETYYVGMGSYTLSERRRAVDVLARLLEGLSAMEVILPDNVSKRHMNVVSKNIRIMSVRVRETCKLYTMQGGDVYNKKKTILVYSPRPLDLCKCTCCGCEFPYSWYYHLPDGDQTRPGSVYRGGDEIVCKDCFYTKYEMCGYCRRYYRSDTMIQLDASCCPSCAKDW